MGFLTNYLISQKRKPYSLKEDRLKIISKEKFNKSIFNPKLNPNLNFAKFLLPNPKDRKAKIKQKIRRRI